MKFNPFFDSGNLDKVRRAAYAVLFSFAKGMGKDNMILSLLTAYGTTGQHSCNRRKTRLCKKQGSLL